MSKPTNDEFPLNKSAAPCQRDGFKPAIAVTGLTPLKQLLPLFFLLSFFCPVLSQTSTPAIKSREDSLTDPRKQMAINFIDSAGMIKISHHWPFIKPDLFIKNIRTMIEQPVSIYPGNGTNFCGYGALTYLLLLSDPEGFARMLLQLYQDGKTRLGNSWYTPSPSIQQAAGQLRFKGKLDIRPAEQMWYLCLADRFKGYLNRFNRRYDPGDEDKLWAAVNYAKFNRMLKTLLRYRIKARGSDIFRPRIADQVKYIRENMKTGHVVLYINNRMLRKKNHATLRLGVPTHYVVAEKIMIHDGLITLVLWDYGGKTQLQLSPAFLRRILFGITHCSLNEYETL